MTAINITLQLDKETIQHFVDALKGFDFYNSLQPINKENDINSEIKVYTSEEASKILKMSKTTIQRYCNNGLIKASKKGNTWFIKESEIKKYLDNK